MGKQKSGGKKSGKGSNQTKKLETFGFKNPNKMETSPLIEECTIAEETSPAAGERMVACVEARGGLVSRVQIGKVSVRCELHMRVTNLSS